MMPSPGLFVESGQETVEDLLACLHDARRVSRAARPLLASTPPGVVRPRPSFASLESRATSLDAACLVRPPLSGPACTWLVWGAPCRGPGGVVGDPCSLDSEVASCGQQEVLARLPELQVSLRPCGNAGGWYTAGQPLKVPERVVQRQIADAATVCARSRQRQRETPPRRWRPQRAAAPDRQGSSLLSLGGWNELPPDSYPLSGR